MTDDYRPVDLHQRALRWAENHADLPIGEAKFAAMAILEHRYGHVFIEASQKRIRDLEAEIEDLRDQLDPERQVPTYDLLTAIARQIITSPTEQRRWSAEVLGAAEEHVRPARTDTPQNTGGHHRDGDNA